IRVRLDREQPVTTRGLAAEVVSHARLKPNQLTALAEAVKGVGPMEVHPLLEAFGQSADEEVGRHLVAALKEAPALSAVRVDSLRQRLAKYGPAVQKDAAELYDRLSAEQGKQTAKLEELLGGLGGGDVRRGQVLFNSNKLACSSCHAIGYI